MKNKLIITESQLKRLKVALIENYHQNKVKEIKQELDDNYEVVDSAIQEGGDYKKEDLVEYNAVIDFGGRVEILSYIEGASTTNLIKKIKDNN